MAHLWTFTGCPKKKVTIGPPKPQFFSETVEIFVVGRLFIADFVLFSDLKNFDFQAISAIFENFEFRFGPLKTKNFQI